MRATLIVIGVILIIGGVAAWFGKITYPHSSDVIKIGDVSASVSHDKTLPQWAGAVGVLAGLGLVAAGAMRKR
ncbi:MAG: hypothetical protein WBV39_15290 [Rudaea sp.]